MDLCKDLKLSITKESSKFNGAELVRIKLSDELNMTELEVCQEINVTTIPSRRYHIREAVVIALRRVVSNAFAESMISDSPGAWKIENIDIEMD